MVKAVVGMLVAGSVLVGCGGRAGMSSEGAAAGSQVEYGSRSVSVKLDPPGGPPGTRVTVTGRGFLGTEGDMARNPGYFFVLDRTRPGDDCEVLAESVRPAVSVDQSGELHGTFTVPSHGSCFQRPGTDRSLDADSYNVILGPHPAFIAKFEVTGS